LLVPVALIIILIGHPGYASAVSLTRIIIFSFLLLLIILRYLTRRKFLKVCVLAASFLPVLLLTLPFVKAGIEPYVSSKVAGEYLLKNTGAGSTILCAKPFLRGIKYYTDRKVAAMGNVFFSPHPVAHLDSDDKVMDFLRKQPVTYCVLNKSKVDDMERIASQGFSCSILKIIGNEYILKILPAKK
ncbi:MAG: hypothetical protein PHG40_04940, partial [Candidatus Omnitrophica bacterium]|nr:hypothetical protein [Candidatus Omnitrophota bacterium]